MRDNLDKENIAKTFSTLKNTIVPQFSSSLIVYCRATQDSHSSLTRRHFMCQMRINYDFVR